MAFDSTGNLYVSGPLNNTITKYPPGGVGSVFADSSDGLNTPIYLAFAPQPTSAALLLGSGAMLLLRRRRAAAR